MANELSFTVTLDNRQMLDAAKKIEAAFKNMNSTAQSEGQKMDATLRKIGGMVGAYFSVQAMQQFAVKVATVRGQFQQLEAAFKILIGSERTANALMSQLMDTAAKTPFGMTDIAQSAKQLLAYGVAAEDVNETLIRLGDIAAGLSIPINDLAYLYGTTMVQGRLYTQDLNQFVGRGIPLIGELAKQFNVAEKDVKGLVEAGRVGFPEVKKAIEALTDEGGKFGGLMDAQSRTITGQISNIEDSIEQMFNEIGKQSEGIISGALGVVSSLVESYERLGRTLAALVASYGVYKAAVITVAATSNGYTVAQLAQYNALLLVEKAQKLLNKTMLTNPYVAVAAGIAAIVTALASMKTQQERVAQAEENYRKQQDELIKKEQERIKRMNELMQVAEDESITTDTRREALVKLEMQYPQIFEKYDTEYDKLKNIKTIKQEIADLEAESSVANAKNELESVDKRIAELQKKHDTVRKEWVPSTTGVGMFVERRGTTQDEETELTMLKARRDELQKEVGKTDMEKYFADLTGISNEELERMIGVRKDLIARMNTQGAEYGKIKTGDSRQTGTFSLDELEAQIKILEREINDRKAETGSSAEWQAKKLKEYNEALATYNAFLSDTTNNMSRADWEEKAKTLKQAVTDTKKAYEATKPQDDGQKTDDKAAEAEARLQQEIAQADIDAMKEGTAKKIAQIELDTRQQLEALEQQKNELIEAQGGTLTDEQAEVITVRRTQITESGEQAKTQVRMDEAERLQAEFDAALEQYGDYYAKRQLIIQQGEEQIAAFMAQFGDMQGADAIAANMQKQINETLGKLSLENLKANLDWDAVFGNVSGQSTAALKTALEQVRTLLATSTESMTTEEIQLLTEAMDGIEGELESRNPFLGLAGALGGLKAEREALIPLLQEQAAAEAELAEAQLAQQQADLEYKEAAAAYADNEDAETLQAKIAAETNLAAATDKVAKSQEKYNTATTKVGKQQNKVNQELKSATSNFRSVGSSVTGIGDQVAELAGIFDDELGDSIGKAMDIIDSMIGGVTSVIDTIANAGLGAVSTISETVNASSTGMQAASAAGAASISAMEKASVILAVISAALQIATAIASAIDPNAAAKKRIEEIEKSLDNLQWRASHMEIENIEEALGGSVLDIVSDKYDEATERFRQNNQELINQQKQAAINMQLVSNGAATSNLTVSGMLNTQSKAYQYWYQQYLNLNKQLESKKLEERADAIKDAFRGIGSAMDEALGDDKWNEYANKIDNYSRQIALLEEEVREQETMGKDKDEEAIAENQQKMQELAIDIVETRREMMKDLFGDDAAGIAEKLADSLVDAFKEGEDAAKAWGDTVNDIVSDVLMNLMVNKYLTPKVQGILDNLINQIYPDGENFIGTEEAEPYIEEASNLLENLYNDPALASLKQLSERIAGGADDTRGATAKGIATASQESVGENNARLTTIQGHTYLLMTGMQELNRTAASALEHLAGIESNTERLIAMDTRMQRMQTALGNIETQGLRLRT